jgi:protocatechuate 3,4-dioxygenase beta subunit
MYRRSTPAPGAADGGPGVDDDEPVGRILSRREVLRLFGGGTAALAIAACVPASVGPVATATPGATVPVATAATSAEAIACVVRPAMTEGPYFVDEMLNRSDIRVDSIDNSVADGVPLLLTFRVQQIDSNSCVPLSGVQVDVWHCDAEGVYSGTQDPGFDTTGHDFLRGFQLTDENGLATFTTIYPGWYSGRTVHIHYKIRTDPAASQGYEFTSQLFFDDSLSDQVFADPPYAARGERNTRNANDGIFRRGDQTVLALTVTDAGYSTVFDIALDLGN